MKKLLFSLLAAALLPLTGATVYRNAFEDAAGLAGFSSDPNIRIENGSLTAEFKNRIEYRTISKTLAAEAFSGYFIRMSCEVRAENILQTKRDFEGIKLELSMTAKSGKKSWGNIRFPKESWDWKKFEAIFPVPDDLERISLAIGMQNSAGKFQLRNLKMETVAVPVNIRSVANMGYRDEVAGDGKGGWTDQGPKQDGRTFAERLWQYVYAGIPIDAIPGGKSVLTLYSEHFTTGPKEAVIPVKAAIEAKTLYLLHALAWAPALEDKFVGTITLKDRNGRIQKISVEDKRDVTDWYRQTANLPNGYGVLKGRTGDGNLAGIYLSRFTVEPGMDEIAEIRFQSVPECIWLILAGTLSPVDIALPDAKPTVIQANSDWLPMAEVEQNRILPGSALDVSAWLPKGSVDELGRVVIKDGHFVFEKNPSQKIRFLTEAMHPMQVIPETHEEIERLAQEIRRNGYNMVRTHFLDAELLSAASKPLEFRRDYLERLDYFIYCMKKNGIYLNFDCMTSWIGYTPGAIWKNKDPEKSFKSRIYFDPAVRKNWRDGVEKLLTRVNPYTKTRLVDDPVLVMAVAFNEQEFGLWNKVDPALILPKWQGFLKDKYGKIENLNAAWKPAVPFKSFEEIRTWKENSADFWIFRLPMERELAGWFKKQLREIGFKGPVANLNCGKSQMYNLLRDQYDFTAMNHYHAHPSNVHMPYSFIDQSSTIAKKALIFRNIAGTRQPGKPFVVTEHHIVFWNRFRYEQGFVIGGYSAFQDYDALTIHAAPVSFSKPKFVSTFEVFTDPVSKASEFLTFFLFRREDVRSGKPGVRIRATEKELFRPDGTVAEALSDEQSLPALMVGENVEIKPDAAGMFPLHPGEIAYKLGSTNSTQVNNAGFSGTRDNPAANAAELLTHLRKSGAIKPENRSNGSSRFETSTGEIYLDSARTFMEINTPRLQGICGLAGTSVNLPDFSIQKMSTDGNLAVVSVDGMKPLRESGRMVLVYATNVLNSGMEFTGPEMVTLIRIGKVPALLRRGAFTVTLKNRNASKLRLYPLDMSGRRLKEIAPDSVNGESVTFSADTGRDGAAIYFEIAEASSAK